MIAKSSFSFTTDKGGRVNVRRGDKVSEKSLGKANYKFYLDLELITEEKQVKVHTR